jgi:hypothetical protein
MPFVIATARELFNMRLGEVRELVKPLRPSPHIHCQFYQYSHHGDKVLAIHDNDRPETDYHEWRSRTFVGEVWCQYFERWIPFESDKRWYLERAYFHLYRTNQRERTLEQFLCIHSDPNCADIARMKRLRSGPHLHVLKAPAPIPDCHFPLNLGHLEAVLSSRPSLTMALQAAIQMICDDVLSRF